MPIISGGKGRGKKKFDHLLCVHLVSCNNNWCCNNQKAVKCSSKSTRVLINSSSNDPFRHAFQADAKTCQHIGVSLMLLVWLQSDILCGSYFKPCNSFYGWRIFFTSTSPVAWSPPCCLLWNKNHFRGSSKCFFGCFYWPELIGCVCRPVCERKERVHVWHNSIYSRWVEAKVEPEVH